MAERPVFSDKMDAIKFLCKEFWLHIFRKQIDKLRTNHKGIFVLTDQSLRWLSHISGKTEEEPLERLRIHGPPHGLTLPSLLSSLISSASDRLALPPPLT